VQATRSSQSWHSPLYLPESPPPGLEPSGGPADTAPRPPALLRGGW